MAVICVPTPEEFKKSKRLSGNPNCDGSTCASEQGEVRVLPIGGGGNLILCLSCFNNEIAWRKEQIDSGRDFDTPTWESLEVYNNA